MCRQGFSFNCFSVYKKKNIAEVLPQAATKTEYISCKKENNREACPVDIVALRRTV